MFLNFCFCRHESSLCWSPTQSPTDICRAVCSRNIDSSHCVGSRNRWIAAHVRKHSIYCTPKQCADECPWGTTVLEWRMREFWQVLSSKLFTCVLKDSEYSLVYFIGYQWRVLSSVRDSNMSLCLGSPICDTANELGYGAMVPNRFAPVLDVEEQENKPFCNVCLKPTSQRSTHHSWKKDGVS